MAPKHHIIAPIGAFGNHIRWIMLLDPKFEICLVPPRGPYEMFAGPDWPGYDEYCRNDVSNVRDDILDEIHTRFAPVVTVDNSTDRLGYFLDNVYSEDRSWHNWLNLEWRWRDSIDHTIQLHHVVDDAIDPSCINLALHIQPEFSLWCYFKFNSSLNNLTIPGYLRDIAQANLDIQLNAKNLNYEILPAEDFYRPVLDQDLYHKLISRFGLENNYEKAKILHARWYMLHEKSRAEYLDYVKNIYSA